MGEVFAGRYELIDPIGRGGVGAVWRAWDQRRGRYVAAKVLQQSDGHTLLRFVREQAMRIDHPHVLAPASWAADDDKVLFTMDLVAGGSLAHLIGDFGPLPPPFVCTLLDQLLSGLQAVHDEGVVHRDIKPANILLEATGRGRPHVRLSDFGISMRKGEPRLTDTHVVMGTPGYFAPEQLQGAEPDFTADQYAVGLVGLSLLTGAKPDAAALVAEFAGGLPAAPHPVPEVLWQVLGTLLHPDPQARFRSATGARKALGRAVELLPAAAGEAKAVEVFDHLGPLPPGYGPDGPVAQRSVPTTAGGAARPAGAGSDPFRAAGPPEPMTAETAAGGAGEPGTLALDRPEGPRQRGGAHDDGPRQGDRDRGGADSRDADDGDPDDGDGDADNGDVNGAAVPAHRPPPPLSAPSGNSGPPEDPTRPLARPARAAGQTVPDAARRPGPPLAAAVPLLVVAVALIAFGSWSLATA